MVPVEHPFMQRNEEVCQSSTLMVSGIEQAMCKGYEFKPGATAAMMDLCTRSCGFFEVPAWVEQENAVLRLSEEDIDDVLEPTYVRAEDRIDGMEHLNDKVDEPTGGAVTPVSHTCMVEA